MVTVTSPCAHCAQCVSQQLPRRVGSQAEGEAPLSRRVARQGVELRPVSRGWIGVQIQPVTADIADSLDLKTAESAMVTEPQANGPAAKAGIEFGDVITAVNGESVKDPEQLLSVPPGANTDPGSPFGGSPPLDTNIRQSLEYRRRAF